MCAKFSGADVLTFCVPMCSRISSAVPDCQCEVVRVVRVFCSVVFCIWLRTVPAHRGILSIEFPLFGVAKSRSSGISSSNLRLVHLEFIPRSFCAVSPPDSAHPAFLFANVVFLTRQTRLVALFGGQSRYRSVLAFVVPSTLPFSYLISPLLHVPIMFLMKSELLLDGV